MMKWFGLLATALNIVQWLYNWFHKAKLKAEARSELVDTLNKEEKAIKDATDKELNSDVSDSDLDKRLQDGTF